jgi:hypothetical protein
MNRNMEEITPPWKTCRKETHDFFCKYKHGGGESNTTNNDVNKNANKKITTHNKHKSRKERGWEKNCRTCLKG